MNSYLIQLNGYLLEMAQSWGEGFKTRREGKKNLTHPTTSRLKTYRQRFDPRCRSRLFLICQEPRISRYYSPSLFYMVTFYIIAVDMWIILYYLLAMFRWTSFFPLDCVRFNFFESGFVSNYPKVSEFIYFAMKRIFCFCFFKPLSVRIWLSYQYVVKYLIRKSYLPISIIIHKILRFL